MLVSDFGLYNSKSVKHPSKLSVFLSDFIIRIGCARKSDVGKESYFIFLFWIFLFQILVSDQDLYVIMLIL